ILDVGAFQTGGLGTISFDTFTDGFTCPPFKTGENFREHHWWELFWKRRTRSSSLNILDDKMRVAGSVPLHTKVSEIVEEFGVDDFRVAIREILEMERRVLIQRIKTQSVPGTYQYRYFWPVRYKGIAGKLFSDSDKDWVLNVPTDLTIRPDGTMYVDLEGLTSEQNFYANSYEGAVRMVSSLGQWTMFAHTPNINTALQYISDWHIPPGSLCNPQNPYSAASLTMGPSKFNFMFREVYSRAFFARGFLEECYPGGSSGSIFGQTGIFTDGTRWGAGDWSMVGAEATAGLPFKDGEVTSYSGPNPQCDSGEVELAEFMAPTNLTFGKRLVPNFCGHGKFRSGLGTGMCFMVQEPGQNLNVNIFLATHGAGHLSTGMSGGYLTPEGVVLIVRGTNMREILEKGGKYPRDMIEIRKWIKEGKLKAESEQLYTYSTPNIELKDGDLFTMIAGSKGGWGDPLEREFRRLEKDAHYGWLTPEAIKSVYGTLIDEKGKVKAAESTELRQQMRDRRRERSVPAKVWWQEERKKVLNKEFSSEEVRFMFADCMKYKKFDKQFRQYHQLPEDYQL
ncbi:MAG: hydantoinase B/oxoprolinase family protein, partial [Dehalococcoidales bacterium]|nr:hydantoinase B/oxoprolinase family protein [Dehalococcoidales bacterium]